MDSELQIATTSSSPPSLYSDFPCQVCAQPAHGKHFGAVTCRACAAFFRRSGKLPESVYKCERKNNCGVILDGRFACKKCKLVKCHEVGMDPKRFQYGRDLISTSAHFKKCAKSQIFINQLPETVEIISGKPNFVIYMDPQPISKMGYIDLQYLIDEGAKILKLGSEKPVFAENKLKKLALGLKIVRKKPSNSDFEAVKKIGKKEALGFCEKDFLAVAKWLTYFDDFQELPLKMQIVLLKSIWHVWTRLDKLSLTAASRRNRKCDKNEMMLASNSSYDTKTVEMDISWITKYPKEKLKFLFDEPHNWMDTETITPLMALQPSDIELTYMLCQLCFHYAGKRHQGEILKVTDRFQKILANDIHNYYVNDLNMPRYSGRLNQMMKINNLIQQDIREKRIKRELALTFSVYCAEFSHPEMFEDTA